MIDGSVVNAGKIFFNAGLGARHGIVGRLHAVDGGKVLVGIKLDGVLELAPKKTYIYVT